MRFRELYALSKKLPKEARKTIYQQLVSGATSVEINKKLKDAGYPEVSDRLIRQFRSAKRIQAIQTARKAELLSLSQVDTVSQILTMRRAMMRLERDMNGESLDLGFAAPVKGSDFRTCLFTYMTALTSMNSLKDRMERELRNALAEDQAAAEGMTISSSGALEASQSMGLMLAMFNDALQAELVRRGKTPPTLQPTRQAIASIQAERMASREAERETVAEVLEDWDDEE